MSMMESQILDHGELVSINKITEGADDNRGFPAEVWTLLATETAWLQDMNQIKQAQVSYSPIGVSDETTHVGFFKHDSAVEADHEIVDASSVKYRALRVTQPQLFGEVSHVEAYLKVYDE